MSIEDCIDRGIAGGEMDEQRGRRAQQMWRKVVDRYAHQGHPRHVAEALAADDVKAAFKREAGQIRHAYLSQIAALRRSQTIVDGSERLATLATDTLERATNSPNQAASVVATKNG